MATSLLKPVLARLWLALTCSEPTSKPATSMGLMLIDQLPRPSTKAVAPPTSTVPLEKDRLTVAPATPVPLMLKPAWDSAVVTLSSSVIAAITGSGASSLRMVPLMAAVVISAPLGLVRVTVKPSSSSTTMSPLTSTVIVWLLSPTAKFTMP